MTAGVYTIRHRESGNLYVGSSKNVRRRLSAHMGHLRKGAHHASHLQNAWNKYGHDAFDFKPAIWCSPEMRLFYEQCLIDGLRPIYNTARIAGTTEGVKRSQELRARISKAARQRRSIHEWKGKKRSLIEIAEMEGVGHRYLISHVCNLGSTVEAALSRKRGTGRQVLEHGGRAQTLRQWADELGIHPRRLQYRITEGYSIADVIARLNREVKSMSFAEHCRLSGANLQTAKSRVQKGMSSMDAVAISAGKIKERV